MPLSMKIQPIDTGTGDRNSTVEIGSVGGGTSKGPVMRSRLKRFFRIASSDKYESSYTETLEPSSLCLAKMVQNFIEGNNEKQCSSSVAKCGRNRCNCFNGYGSGDGSDADSDSVSTLDICDFLKNLVVCVNVNERNVLKETAKIVADKSNKVVSKRKDELRKIVTQGLVSLGYDAAICKSKWDKSSSFPAGEYEYMDVMIGQERLIIDIDFRSEFEVARSTKTYKSILQTLPNIFVGKSDRLSKIIGILSEAAKQSLKKKDMHIPPWRKIGYVQAKWLSPPTRLASPTTTTIAAAATITPTPPQNVLPTALDSDEPSPNGSDLNQSPTQFEPVFDMSESSGEEDIKVKGTTKEHKSVEINPKKSYKSGLASIMEEKP